MKNRKSINKDIISIFVAMDRKILYQQTERTKQPNVSFYLWKHSFAIKWKNTNTPYLEFFSVCFAYLELTLSKIFDVS